MFLFDPTNRLGFCRVKKEWKESWETKDLTCLKPQKQGMCDTVALPFILNSILRQKKNYGNSNISPFKNIISRKSTKRNQNPSIYYNSIITNLKFQHKPNYHLSKILSLPRGQNP
jgi:hypothetical protein